MSEPAPMTEVLRAWRKIGAREQTDQAGDAAFDEANALGLDDRTLLIAATRLALRLTNDYAAAVGMTINAMLEALLREFVEQGET